jgi:peptidoglycan/xylan/chitin deacetylase (PgdA/CDA1 family)
MSWPSLPGRASATLRRVARPARAGLLRLLGPPAASVLERLARTTGRKAGVALVYHLVGDPPGDPRRELVPALGSQLFADQVRFLTSRFRVVPASELLRTTRERRRGERFPVAITFDDDLRAHVDVAARSLRSAGATATFFLTGASLERPNPFWWERLQIAVDRGLPLSELGLRSVEKAVGIHELGREIENLPASRRTEIDAELARLVGADSLDSGLRPGDVRSLAADGFEIGFHTRRHHRLPTLEPEALERAMSEGRPDLEHLLGSRLTAIAYPHGQADERVAQAARSAGFELGFTGQPEPVTPSADPLLLGRLSPSYASVGELALEIAWALLRGRRR